MGPAEITVLDSAAHISAQRVAAVQRIHSVSDLASTTGPVEYFYASDASAIIEHTKKIVFLEDDDVISIDVSHPQGARIIPSCQLESWYAYTNQTRIETLIVKNSTLTVQFTQLACARGLAWLPKTSAAQISPPRPCRRHAHRGLVVDRIFSFRKAYRAGDALRPGCQVTIAVYSPQTLECGDCELSPWNAESVTPAPPPSTRLFFDRTARSSSFGPRCAARR